MQGGGNVKKKIFAFAILFLSATAYASGLVLGEDGRALYEIEVSSNATHAELYAAGLIREVLSKESGVKFRLVGEADAKKTSVPRIRVGGPQYSQVCGLAARTYDPEEWRIRTVGKDIVITGGRPRGVLYAAREFLERFAGYRFYSIDMEVIPEKKRIEVPAEIDISGKPAFRDRCLYFLYKGIPAKPYWNFVHANRMNAHGRLPEYGFSSRFGRPGGVHSLLDYAKDFPPEISWMDSRGQRIRVQKTTDGQICYTHPEVRRRIVQEMLENIRRDREDADKEKAPYPVFYDLSTNDSSVPCYCPECQKCARKYGVSGMVIDFTNTVADEIARKYKDVFVVMIAYKEAMAPPVNIRPRDNVVVRLAYMDAYFGGRSARDVLRPLDHPHNRNYLDDLEKWHKIAKNLAVWDYWIIPSDPFLTPKTAVSSRAGYLRKYRDLGVVSLFLEAELDDYYLDSFTDLRNYLTMKLMVNPDLNDRKLIEEFMDGFYGPASAPMLSYLDYLETRMKEEPDYLALKHPSKRAYLDAKFFVDADRFLGEAEKLAAGNPKYLANVRQERLIVDCCYLNLLKQFGKPPLDTPKEVIVDRMLKALDAFGAKYYTSSYWQKNREQVRGRFLAGLERPPLPEAFAGKNAIDLVWCDFPQRELINDPESAAGKAVAVSEKNYPFKIPFHSRPLAFGIYSQTLKKSPLSMTFPFDKLPSDERYHWYYLGRANIPENCVFWVHWSWQFQARIGMVHDKDDNSTQHDAYISLKVQGPAYVKGSQKSNQVIVERMIFERVVKGTPRPCDPGLLNEEVHHAGNP